jgi:putative hydrolase of the HAD superfamily
MGTLFGLRQTVGEIYGAIAARHGVRVEPLALTTAFFETFRSAPPLAFGEANTEKLARLEFQWWYRLAAQTFIQVGLLSQFANFETFFQELYNHFATASPWILYPDVLPTLQHWQGRGVTLSIISNFDSRLEKILQLLDLDSYFASILYSSRCAVAKPHRQIFYQALALHQTEALQAWHIGDSPQEDYYGAQTAGLRAFLLQRASLEIRK